MAVLFGGAGVAVFGTFLLVFFQNRQGQRFAAIASEADPASRRVPRPGTDG